MSSNVRSRVLTLPLSEIVKEYNFFTIEECRQIKEYAYKKEEELIREGHKDNDTYGKSITTNNHTRYNFFKDNPQYVDRLVDFLVKTNKYLIWPIMVQSWVNIYRKGEGIDWHVHLGNMGTDWSANIFIDGPTKPGVNYLIPKKSEINTHTLENKKGYMHIFPCETMHSVEPLTGNEERISVGMTIHSYNYIDRPIISSLAFNSKREVEDTLILTNEHYYE